MSSSVHFSFSALYKLKWLSHLQQSPVYLQFPLPDAVTTIDATPTHWAFYFQGSGLLLSVNGSWLDSMCMAHIALQELQTIAMMLCRLAFCLSGKVVALHLDSSTEKAYLSKHSGSVSFSYHTGLPDITLIPAYIPTHLNVEANYLSEGQMLPEWHLLPQMA